MIFIDRTLAEGITRNRLRTERVPLLDKLDIDFMRALEAGLPTADIAAQKQALRDAPDKDLSSLTIDQLASLTIDGALAL